jgi:hypothetical protein
MPASEANQEAELMAMANGALLGAPEMIRAPSYGFDITRGTIPLLLVIALMGIVATASWRVGAYVQADVTERTVILSRLDKIEAKIDRVIKLDRPIHTRAKRPG